MTNQEFLESISLEGEEWRDVVGYEGLYSVSNKSRIATLPNKGRTAGIKKQTLMRHGYLYVSLWKNNKIYTTGVHRIIAESWIDNPHGYTQIDHLDGCRSNNSISNLRWCTHEMNNNNPITKLRQSKAGRTDQSKSLEIACLKDGALVKIYPYGKAVLQDGFHDSCVCRCLQGKSKHHHGYTWMYLSDYENLLSTMSKNS